MEAVGVGAGAGLGIGVGVGVADGDGSGSVAGVDVRAIAGAAVEVGAGVGTAPCPHAGVRTASEAMTRAAPATGKRRRDCNSPRARLKAASLNLRLISLKSGAIPNWVGARIQSPAQRTRVGSLRHGHIGGQGIGEGVATRLDPIDTGIKIAGWAQKGWGRGWSGGPARRSDLSLPSSTMPQAT